MELAGLLGRYTRLLRLTGAIKLNYTQKHVDPALVNSIAGSFCFMSTLISTCLYRLPAPLCSR